MKTVDYDLVVAGAGPVGLATAIYARLAGMSVAVLDPRHHPEHKACGEGIMPRGRRALRDMGVEIPATRCSPFIGIRFVDGATVAEGRFSSAPGCGIRRTTLWQAMSSRAAEVGTAISLGEKVTDWQTSSTGVDVGTPHRSISARILVAADGLHSAIRRKAGLDSRPARVRRYGMRRHYRCPPWSPFVEVHWDDLAEAYVTPVDSSTVGVAILGQANGRSHANLLERFPVLRERLSGAVALDRVLGAGPFGQRVKRKFGAGVVLVGDAAGYIDPLTGEGLTLGFDTAKALIAVLARGAALREYQSAYRRLTRNHVILTRGLLSIAARPALRRRVVRGLARAPELFDSFLAVNAGEKPLTQIGAAGALRAIRAALATTSPPPAPLPTRQMPRPAGSRSGSPEDCAPATRPQHEFRAR